ncbi:hypothetical protein GCM10007874_31870 [Labrys miyagiensis]|uniref:Ribosome modulation factor n=1 Tax=Labrys miyagiensis TaxID=346912 RepID=A0ABQ6CMQ5_9HYPH|nr:hypothetical protein [Labrys miyagiensis]GLS20170.1 hypothetical protein GCM10007874_31870 [Labrys miyagiensis]
MEQATNDAFCDGEIARWTGYSEDANPCDPDIDRGHYRRWSEGWHSADNDLDDADGD